MKKTILGTSLLFLIIFLLFNKYLKNKDYKPKLVEKKIEEKSIFNSNIITNINYNVKDDNGNEYLINDEKGEIDENIKNIIFLKNVKAIITLKNSNKISIASDFGKYNISNNDTIFSKNVFVHYLENKITCNYLDLSIKKNLIMFSKDVIYSKDEVIMKADAIEMNIKTKDIKVYMHNLKEKITINN